jgi:hypothetical protein
MPSKGPPQHWLCACCSRDMQLCMQLQNGPTPASAPQELTQPWNTTLPHVPCVAAQRLGAMQLLHARELLVRSPKYFWQSAPNVLAGG